MKETFYRNLFHIEGDKLELCLIGTYEARAGALPFYWWDIVRKSDHAAVGKISFRIGHDYHSYYNGNIGYEIDEPYRGHHYALEACRLSLHAAKAHEMGKLNLTCDYDNAASYKTIEKLGGVLMEEVCPPKDWIYYREGIKPHKIYELSIE